MIWRDVRWLIASYLILWAFRLEHDAPDDVIRSYKDFCEVRLKNR